MTSETLAPSRSRSRTRTQDLTIAALLAAMIAGTAWISIQFGPVPVTLQTMFVLLAGLVLTPGWAATSMGLYLVLGVAGLPVFARGQSGLAAVLGPTGGFLIAFPLAAAVVSIVYRSVRGAHTSGQGRATAAAAVAVVVGEVVIYALGVPWLMRQTNMSVGEAFALAVAPFLVSDAIKAVLAVGLAQAVRKAMMR